MLNRIFRTSLVLCCLALQAPAQEACAAFMHFGVYDEYNVAATKTEFNLIKHWLCKSNYRNFRDAQSDGMRIGVDIDDFGKALFGSNTDKETADISSSQLCTSDYEHFATDQKLVQTIRSVSPQITAMVKQCLKNQEHGFSAWLTPSADLKTVTFNARYKPMGRESAKIRAFDVHPAGVSASCGRSTAFKLLRVNQTIGSESVSLTCSRSPKQTTTFTINTDKGAATIALDGVKESLAGTPHLFSLDANAYSTARQFLDTGINVPAGAHVKILVEGTACEGVGLCFDADGNPGIDPNCTAKGIKCGAAYARFGTNGTMFAIGKKYESEVIGGILFLGYGDTNYLDNSGTLAVKIWITNPTSDATVGRVLDLSMSR